MEFLLKRRSFVHMAIAAGLSSFVGYSIISFMPSFMGRSFGIGIATLGVWLGLILGIAGGAGFFFGGLIADRFGRTSQRRALRFIAITILLSAALLVLCFVANSWYTALLFFIVPAATSNVYLAPVLAQTQGLVSLRMRAVASALMLLIINIIGLALGPWMTGLLSDALEPQFAADSMRYALLTISVIVLPWATLHYLLASRYIDDDLRRATASD